MAIKIFVFWMVLLAIFLPSNCAPRSKHGKNNAPQLVYDQKQTGDFNVQVHLKDFQLIALIGDDLGLEDIDYDYADFTLKPSTAKPSESTPPPSPSPLPSSTSQVPSSTLKPSNHPYPIELPSTTEPPKEKPVANEELVNQNKEPKPNKEEIISNELQKTKTNVTNKDQAEQTNTALQINDKPEETNSPGKIKVQIIETPLTPVNVGIVPGEEVHEHEGSPQGEILQIRRCATGFTRDKKGRCKRVRRPVSISSQLPFGFGRLASNFVSRFKYPTPDDSSTSSTEP